ncbi:hypothetical protein yc1106_03539 [Curvularia clavata]|uniref:Alpha/beta hydrolase fold-3 domain-containing protein n=1 Tax=Curvularia clavata TaxID=95742 RepID=A0A9Q8Z6V7_CURCL|nr:hypothetical protein yc1106_03539 [Curvularia clavata]
MMTNNELAKPWLEFEEEWGGRMALTPPVSNMLQQFAHIGELLVSKYDLPAPDSSVETEDTTTDKGTKVRIYTPVDYNGDRPVCMYYHGGGWAMGDINADDGFSRAISKAGNIVVISVEYGLAPQNAHPGLMNECYEALKWALNNSQRLKTAGSRFITSGVSAGGHIAFGTALRAIDEGLGDQVVGILSIMPPTVHPDAVPDEMKARYTAMEEHDQNTLNTAGAMRAFWDAFGASPTDHYASPLLHPRTKDLKRVYMVAASHDTLRDDALLMKEKLDEAGVSNRFDMFEGYPHFFMGWPSSKLDQPRKEFFEKMANGLDFILS